MHILKVTVFVEISWIAENKVGTICIHLARTLVNYIQILSGRIQQSSSLSMASDSEEQAVNSKQAVLTVRGLGLREKNKEQTKMTGQSYHDTHSFNFTFCIFKTNIFSNKHFHLFKQQYNLFSHNDSFCKLWECFNHIFPHFHWIIFNIISFSLVQV